MDPVPKITARSYIVVDGDSGEMLAELNPHLHVAPASTTKIITALVALQNNNLNEVVTARFDQSELIDSTLMGLRIGDQITLEDLLYGLMLPSGNDAALAIANHVAGSKVAFVERMNQLTAELGLQDSHWANPHGLDAVGHYSSAYDMVQFARAGMPDPRFQAIASARMRTIHSGSRTYDVYNLNRLIGNVPGADGVKIGYTDDAGRTMVASVTRNGHRIYVGAFHINDQLVDTRPLVEWAFKNFSWS
jgi:D-alanyl-D-alanine carboxypeptidase (penicillin-binding protein 5/6)